MSNTDQVLASRSLRRALHYALAEQHIDAVIINGNLTIEVNSEELSFDTELDLERFLRASRMAPPADLDDDSVKVLNAIVEYYGSFDEIWLRPALRNLAQRMREEVPLVKRSLHRLESYGIISLEERKGKPHDYHVICLNEDHPLVQEARSGLI